MQNILFCLVVDDEPLAQQVLETYIDRTDQLELAHKCESVEEAYQIICSEQIDVIFLDLNLGAISGMELVKTQVDKKRYFLIITSSLSSDQVNLEDTIASDNFILVDYLTKPFSFDQFLQSIEKVKALK